jgi:urea transport system permease protein
MPPPGWPPCKRWRTSASPATRGLLLPLVETANESDATVRAAAAQAVKDIESRLAIGETLGKLFTGVSLGSILLLAALGLAITYGVMGVINMAHGELLMVGAYATYFMQTLFRAYFPDYIDWYLLAAIPAAFAAAALVGMLLERTVIRRLYGRPLETLLATWGLSLILIQAARVLFGAQNVEVANPVWMSGGVEVMAGLVLPWNRIVIVGFTLFVLALIWALMQKTRLGLFVRAVTQNRPMAGCVGVPTGRVDTLAFGLGAGIAGLGGVALSQIANVGPDMGQGYIVDSFLVVVLGGVGQLAGAVWAALGLGVVTKFLEGWWGAVIAKIVVLVIVIIFIQKRPQGLFALKGRFVEN